MKLNTKLKPAPAYTHGGARTTATNPEQELRRTVMACMLWEDQFYEDGKSIADRIRSLVAQVSPEFAAACAYHARTDMHLRHVPLLIVREMARLPEHKKLVGRLLPDVIQRADEITEFLAIYWKDKRQPLSAQVKKGLAEAFTRFTEYDLGKYDRDGQVKLRDALFLCHGKPLGTKNGDRYTKAERKAEREGKNEGYELNKHELLYKRIIDRKLAVPDTWEVALSGGGDKLTTWRRLLTERKLGALAFLRNLRNMIGAGITEDELKKYSLNLRTDRVLPFRFIAAAKIMPQLEPMLEPLMLKCTADMEKIKGKTLLLVDVSGSMNYKLSDKSDMTRMDAACGLAVLCREVMDDVTVVSFSNDAVLVPPRHGFALRDAIVASQPYGGTQLETALRYTSSRAFDRIIVITDEQAAQRIGPPSNGARGYIINVASYRNGVGQGIGWHKIDGWSENVLSFIRELENEDNQ